MKRFLKKGYAALIYLFLYAPILILIVFSFNASKSRGTWAGFTFNWYLQLFKDRQIMKALSNTMIIAVLSAVIATVIGTAAATYL